MKLLAITLKDISQSFRSHFALAFMFGVPILVTGMFYFMFGGLRNEGKGFEIPQTSVLIVNLDQGWANTENRSSPETEESPNWASVEVSGASGIGEVLIQVLQNESLAEILSVTTAESADLARRTVERGEVDVAVIIPEDFTQAVMNLGDNASLEIYQDPTLTMGPAIVRSILDQFVQEVSNAMIGIGVTLKQLGESGLVVEDTLTQEVVTAFTAPMQAGNHGEETLYHVKASESTASDSHGTLTRILPLIMGGMMVFYAFFTGASSAQSILTEEEKGTLSRLFTTPTSTPTILGGKFLAVLLTILVQVSVLLIFSRYVFSIYWGRPVGVSLATAGLILLATTCGLFIISFLKNSRQAGMVFGGVLTFTGMIGIFPIFTAGMAATPRIFNQVSLIVPQGWAMHNLRLAMDEAPLKITLMFFVGQLAWSMFFFLVGLTRLRKRFE